MRNKRFGDLKVGARFGFLEHSDVDHPYSQTKRVLVKTNLNKENQYEDDNYINAVSVTDGDDYPEFIIDEDEEVTTEVCERGVQSRADVVGQTKDTSDFPVNWHGRPVKLRTTDTPEPCVDCGYPTYLLVQEKNGTENRLCGECDIGG